MNYTYAIDYINSIGYLGSKLGLERMSRLMDSLGNPQKKLKVIHIAGTNGKGSVSAMLSSILIENGYRVGVYISPHLVEYTERFTINNVKISREEFSYYVERVKSICDTMEDRPTVFEVLTAIGFLYFQDKEVDFAVLEVGLGGRFDATNIIEKPVLSVITSISLDHEEILGKTIANIAFEKAGIIKEGCPVSLYPSIDIEAYNVVSRICNEKGVYLYFDENEKKCIIKQDILETVFKISNKYLELDNIKLHLIGDFQIENASLVLTSAFALEKAGIALSLDKTVKGLYKARWRGRMDIISKSPYIIFDGAHNIEGIKALSTSLEKYFKNKKITLLVGILEDKAYEKMLETIMPKAEKIVFTEPLSKRAWHINSLKITENKPIYKEADIKSAFKLATSITDKDGVLCCAGSLYLIGELYRIWEESYYDKF